MTYTGCCRINITVWFVPPYGEGVNSIWSQKPDGSVVLMYKYHEHRTIDGRKWPLRQLN